MRVLITGGGGFIGSHLVDSQLVQGHRVRTVDLHVERLAHAVAHPNLEVVVGDITQQGLVDGLVEGVDVVYHLASAHLDINQPAAHYQRVNVDASRSLVEAAHKASVQRLVHCSSNSVLGEIRYPPADEMTPCRPTNVYERTKLAGEQVVLDFAHRTGFPVVVVRPAWVYGPRCPRTEKLLRTIGKGRFVMFGDGSTWRHPLYISDAVQGLERAAAADDVAGEVYFIAGEYPVTIEELVRTVAEVKAVRPPAVHLPVAMGKVAGYLLQTAFIPLNRQPPFSRRSLDFFVKDNMYDISKARRDLAFQPQVVLRTGLERTLHWIKSRNNPEDGGDGIDG